MPVEGGVIGYLERRGRPIRYAYVPREYPAADYQTVFAREPGSAEMPSAGRPFTADSHRLVSAPRHRTLRRDLGAFGFMKL